MALHSLYCADVPLRNCSLTHCQALKVYSVILMLAQTNNWSKTCTLWWPNWSNSSSRVQQ